MNSPASCDAKQHMRPYTPVPLTEDQKMERRAGLKAQLLEVLQHGRVTCECGESIAVMHAYKCFYCGFWFCPACARIHFAIPEHIQDADARYGEGSMAKSKRKPTPVDCGQTSCSLFPFRTVEPHSTTCALCTHEYCRLRKAVFYANSNRRESIHKSYSRQLMKQAERESPQTLYWVLRALYGLIQENNDIDVIDAYELLGSFVPQTAAEVFDYNQKERGRGYPRLGERIRALLEEEAARQEKIKAKQAAEAAQAAPTEAAAPVTKPNCTSNPNSKVTVYDVPF